MKCNTCEFAWCGSFTPHLNRALFHCRKPELHARPKIIGDGSYAALKQANGCATWKEKS